MNKAYFFKGMMKADDRNNKGGGINEPLELHNFFKRKILTSTVFLFAPAAEMLGTSRFPIGCMIWQRIVILESICATNSITIVEI